MHPKATHEFARVPHRRVLAEQTPLLGGQALAVHLVLLQLLVVRVPEFHDGPLDVKGVDSVCRNDLPVHLGQRARLQLHFTTQSEGLRQQNVTPDTDT